MRIITMLTGVLFTGAGIFLIAHGGLTFMSKIGRASCRERV